MICKILPLVAAVEQLGAGNRDETQFERKSLSFLIITAPLMQFVCVSLCVCVYFACVKESERGRIGGREREFEL